MDNVTTFIKQNRDRIVEELREFLTIPSVSTLREHDQDCRRAATWLASHLERLGCRKVDLCGSETHPVVCADGPEAPGKPTVLIYGHYDVQPPDPLRLWESPPFEPVIRNGDIVARGATDDKGQVFALIKAFEAVATAVDGKPPVNLRFMIEGQEESGSTVLTALLDQQSELVAVDAVLVSDMPYYRKRWPAVYTALRGICYCEVTVRTLKGDLHSGLYGGTAPNAHEVLVNLLASLKGKRGRIRIPGLYDDVEPPTKKERKAWDALPYNQKTYLRKELGAKAVAGSKRESVFEKTWALPTLEIHGITGGFMGEGAKTVIPAEATAKVSLRLVPNQRAKKVERLLRRAVKELAPAYADVTVTFIHGGDPVQTDVGARPVRLMSQAFKEVEGREAVPIRSGGSIPIVPALGRRKAPVVLTGIGLPDDRLHAPNEKLALNQFWTGVRAFARFFDLMGSE